MHTGCQWYKLPIDKDEFGREELSYSRIFRGIATLHKTGNVVKRKIFCKLFSYFNNNPRNGDGEYAYKLLAKSLKKCSAPQDIIDTVRELQDLQETILFPLF